MKGSELLRLVLLNINQNKFKTIMTSIGIVAGAATIVMVIAIGRGGQMDVAEQFSSLNAGAIDITYEWEGEEERGGFMSGGIGSFISGMFGGGMPGFGGRSSGGGMPGLGGESSEDGDAGNSGFGGRMPDFGRGEMPEGFSMPDGAELPEKPGLSEDENTESKDTEPESEADTEKAAGEETEESLVSDRMNQENVILSADDVEDIELFVSGITGVTISYSSRGSIEGGNLTSAQTMTVAGVKESYASVSNFEYAAGEFFTESEDAAKSKVCVLGSSVAKEIFGNAEDAYESTIYIDDRTYTVTGVLKTTGTVSGGISPDDVVFVPYETGIKYITGETIRPTITVIARDVNVLDSVIRQTKTVLEENYNNTEFTFSDAGSKMEAAQSSNRILTMLLSAMAVIVFIVGGIGIMNVLFVSVKERTGEIGILKALGASRSTILLEFLMESAAISLIGGTLGVGISFLITPIVELYDIRVEANMTAWMAALGFAVLTGTLFGFYPAWKASRLVPVEALNAE